MKRTLLGIVAVAALGATLVSTGAFVDTVELNSTEDKIEMEPSNGPNAVYAVEDADGEIKLDLSAQNQALAGEGINEESLTKIPNIFTVNYSAAAGEPAAKVWFTSDAEDGIEFVVGTDSVTSIGAGSKQRLKPTEKFHVGVIVDTRGDHDVESVSEFTIHVETIDEGDKSSGGSTYNEDGGPDADDNTGQTGGTNQDDTGSGLDADDNTDGGDESGDNDAEGDGTGSGDGETAQTGGDGDTDQNGEEGANDDNGGGGVFQTTGQGPSFPGPAETLGGFLSGRFLWLIVAVLLGAALFAATRYGTERFGGTA